ncbi:MAG: discoidin domain-containing protein [Limnochordia bacterium]|jgi:hypothetical protein
MKRYGIGQTFLLLIALLTMASPVWAKDVDLALNQPVAASNVMAGSPAANAVDGDNNSFWRVSTLEGEISLTVDLGEVKKINRYVLRVYGYPNMSGYRIQVSLDGEVWTDAYVKIGEVKIDETGTFPVVEGRYVRYEAFRNQVRSSAIGLRTFSIFYDAAPTLVELKVPETNYVRTNPLESIYDVVVPTHLSAITIQAVTSLPDHQVIIAGIPTKELQVDISDDKERVVPLIVTGEHGNTRLIEIVVKRPPLYSDRYVLTFEDHFVADELNSAYWYYRTDAKWEGYNLPGNVRLGQDEDGRTLLYIDFKKQHLSNYGGPQWTGGGIISRHNMGYGYYEVLAKLYDDTPGFHQSFWSRGTGAIEDVVSGKTPQRNGVLEIDGFEVDSGNSSRVSSTIHQHFPTVSQFPNRSHHTMGTTEWFTWGYEWLPGRVNFYGNGEYVATIYQGDLYAPQNLWLTGLADGRTDNVMPLPGASMQVDYVRYYARVDNQTNWVGNKSFEYTNGVDIYAWIAAGDVLATKGVAAARTGEWALEHSFYRPYRAVTKQCLQFIANGTYRLSAWVMSTGGQTEAKLQVTDSQGTLAEIDIPQSSEWMQVQLDVAVTNNEAEINIISAGSGSGIWLRVDDLEFVRVE